MVMTSVQRFIWFSGWVFWPLGALFALWTGYVLSRNNLMLLAAWPLLSYEFMMGSYKEFVLHRAEHRPGRAVIDWLLALSFPIVVCLVALLTSITAPANAVFAVLGVVLMYVFFYGCVWVVDGR